MVDERVERVGHVAVTQVPAVGAAPERRSVVLLRVHDQARVQLGVEVVVQAVRGFRGERLELNELRDRVVFTPLRAAEALLIGVELRKSESASSASASSLSPRTKRLTR
jgi:hypothetical protein